MKDSTRRLIAGFREWNRLVRQNRRARAKALRDVKAHYGSAAIRRVYSQVWPKPGK
jgi:hypothetical protein